MVEKYLMRSVTDAALELCCGNALLKDRLLSAVQSLKTALIRRADWPVRLRQRAQDIADELDSQGTPEQFIAAMDPQSAQRLAERILHLYADCCVASSADQS
jgi:hypothetical protein